MKNIIIIATLLIALIGCKKQSIEEQLNPTKGTFIKAYSQTKGGTYYCLRDRLFITSNRVDYADGNHATKLAVNTSKNVNDTVFNLVDRNQFSVITKKDGNNIYFFCRKLCWNNEIVDFTGENIPIK